jgi:hypothetical protein
LSAGEHSAQLLLSKLQISDLKCDNNVQKSTGNKLRQ